MLISGLSDHNIPKRHAEAIFQAAAGPKELWLVPVRATRKPCKPRLLSFSAGCCDFSLPRRLSTDLLRWNSCRLTFKSRIRTVITSCV